ncbi:MAG TPA: hypothetical protein VM123_14515 [archaeon]|nr:hypothetical protein [archaeon]
MEIVPEPVFDCILRAESIDIRRLRATDSNIGLDDNQSRSESGAA